MKQRTIEQRFYGTYGLGMLLMLLVSVSITLYYNISRQQSQIDQSISGMAAMLAEMPMIRQAVEEHQAVDELSRYLDQVRQSTEELDVITVCTADSVRIYHPDRTRIGGTFVGGDETEILQGSSPYVTDGEGTLGPQRRAFHAIRNEEGKIIGFVMVSMFTQRLRRMKWEIMAVYLVTLLVLLAAGVVLTHHTMDYLKELFLGYRPEEFVTRYVERSEVLDVLDEGIFAINPEGKVILMNQSGRRMLGLEPDQKAEGELLTSLYPDTRLPEVMETGQAQYNVTMALGHRHILTSRIPLTENGRTAGAISIFRDKTEVMKLANELTGTKDMVDTLRAFNHEFMNKLHVILGYLQLGEYSRAIDFITNTTLVSSQAVRAVTNGITVAHLSALIIGKMMRASELGITLRLKNGSYCTAETLILPVDGYVTIIGNLLENAMEELNAGSYPVKDVELGIYCDEKGSLITCEDTGGGIREDVRKHIFERGVSTKGDGRGTGLPLVKSLVDQYQGEISIETEVGEGTCITVSFLAEQQKTAGKYEEADNVDGEEGTDVSGHNC